MIAEDVDFASLLCSRLCHDLMSPVGAFANGLELLADESDPELRGQYVELLEASARASTAKLKFFRLAFGAAGGLGDKVDMAEARAAAEALFAERKGFELAWIAGPDMLSKPAAKVLLNLVLIAGDALLRGGRLDIGVEASPEGGAEIVIRAEGPRLKLDDEVRGALQSPVGAELSSRSVAAGLAAHLVRSSGGSLQISEDEEGVLLIGASLGKAI